MSTGDQSIGEISSATRQRASSESGSRLKPVRPTSSTNMLGLLGVQFCSLYNDHTLKQIVLLLLVADSLDKKADADLQGLAIGLFALPFLLLAGPAGRLADRLPKRSVILGCKYFEVALMAAVGLIFQLHTDPPRGLLLVTLFLMAAQSAYLTPAKYGVISELYPADWIAKVNAWMQVLGYLAIVLGASTGGWLLGREAPHARWTCFFFLTTATLGVLFAHSIGSASRSGTTTPPGRPKPTDRGGYAPNQIRHFLKRIGSNRRLSDALLTYGVLWLLAGVYQPIVNLFCRQELGLGPWGTSLMLSLSVIGIASGCGVAMIRRRHGWTVAYLRQCVVGVVICQFMLSMLAKDTTSQSVIFSALLLGLMGVLTGAVVLPLHVMIQLHAPAEIRGRVLATQGFVNWVAILTAGIAYQTLSLIADRMNWMPSQLFLPVASFTLLVALGLRGRGEALIAIPLLHR